MNHDDSFENSDYVTGNEFHNGSHQRIYARSAQSDGKFFKTAELMAKVAYTNAHENHAFPPNDPKHGIGKNYCKWLASEQTDTKENFSSHLDGILESRLEPGASIGWHKHTDTEEYYIILEGSMFIECQDAEGNIYSQIIHAGDMHRVAPGMSHFAKASDEGVRFLAVIVK